MGRYPSRSDNEQTVCEAHDNRLPCVKPNLKMRLSVFQKTDIAGSAFYIAILAPTNFKKEHHNGSWPPKEILRRMSVDKENNWQYSFTAIPINSRGGKPEPVLPVGFIQLSKCS